MLEAKAFLLSPAELGVVISLKHTRQRAVLTHGPFFASVCTRLCQYVIWGFGNGLKKRRKTKTQVAQNPESIEPQGFPGCIFFGNKRHVGASSISLAPTFFTKVTDVLIPQRLLFRKRLHHAFVAV